MLLSNKQIKAARAMLDWSRAELSAKSGVSEPNIVRLEAGGDGRSDTFKKISDAFETHGIVFTVNGGIEPLRPELRTYQTSDGLQKFLDDVYNEVQKHGGDIIITGVDEKQFSDAIDKEFGEMHVKRMSKLKNYTMRCLIEDGDTNFIASDYCQYKWTRSEQFRSVPFYIYGNRIAFIQFDVPVDAPLIVVLESKAITDAFRAQFEGMWKNAKTPPGDKK
jgi:transcriptional regulator with XRE-family HTH domain